MAESGIIIAYLDGLGSRATPQVVGSLRADLKSFATGGDFKRAQRTLCRYRGDVEVEDGCDYYFYGSRDRRLSGALLFQET